MNRLRSYTNGHAPSLQTSRPLPQDPDLRATQEIRASDILDHTSQLRLARYLSSAQDAHERIDEGLRNVGRAIVVMTVAVACCVVTVAAHLWICT